MIDRLHLSLIFDLRRRAGLSQVELADLLGTTRSQVSLAEKMLRPLPLTAELKLIDLLKQYPPVEEMPAGRKAEVHTTAQEEAMRQFAAGCPEKLVYIRYAKTTAQKKLVAQQKAWIAETENLRLLEVAIASMPTDHRLARRKEAIQKKLLRCGHLAQVETQYAIELCELEEELLQWKIEEAAAKELPPDEQEKENKPAG